jgi:muramoyltetrapeptide carboxypeptidase
VKAIFFARGGYGTSRIIDRLDLAPLRQHPKVVAGYSDTTALLLAIQAGPGLAVLHGPFLTDAPADMGRLLRTVSGKTEPLSISRLRPLRPGRVTAPVTGGNLSLLAHSVGTPFEVDTGKRILFVEEVKEAPYRVDRMVRQLVMARKFHGLRGLIIGRFSGISRSEKKKCEQLLLEATAGKKIPVAAGFPAGHGPGNRTFPLGVPATLDTAARSITFSSFLAC